MIQPVISPRWFICFKASPSTVSGILGLSFSTQATTPTLGHS